MSSRPGLRVLIGYCWSTCCKACSVDELLDRGAEWVLDASPLDELLGDPDALRHVQEREAARKVHLVDMLRWR